MLNSREELGERIAHARSTSGFTQHDLASKLGLDRTAVTRIESGDRKVDSFELARIAEVLKRPIAWFMMSPAPNIASRRRGREGAAERAADIDLELIAADVEQLVEMELLKPTRFAGLGYTVDSVESAERAATDVRRQLGNLDQPIIDLVSAFERLGLHTFVLEMETNVEGAYVALENSGIALVQGRDPIGKRRFTAAHEFGHHIFQDDYSAEWVTGGQDEGERLVSAFAIHFLLPRPGVMHRWNELRGAEDPRNAAIFVAADFGASWTAVCAQLANLGLIEDDERRGLAPLLPTRFDFAERGLAIQDSPKSPLLPPAFVAAVLRGYRSHLLGRERALEMLRGFFVKDELPPLHDVPLEAMLGEFGPLE